MKEFAEDNFDFDGHGRKVLLKGRKYKRLCEKEKLLIMSNFSFSNSVFKGLELQTLKNQALFGKGLKAYEVQDFGRILQELLRSR